MRESQAETRDAVAPAGRPDVFALAFAVTASLFFLWAVAHNLNDILVRQFETALQLSRAQASFIQLSFYLAYFVFAIPAGIAMRRLGLKRTMITGLLLFAAGAAAFYPAAEAGAYAPFLVALFVIASGIVCLEIAAGAFMVLAGPSQTSAFRINLAQAFNGVGAVTAPVIGGLFIFSGHERSAAELAGMSPAALAALRRSELHQVQIPYLCVAGAALLIALVIALVRYPAETPAPEERRADFLELLRAPGYLASVLAQFAYVGAQVATWSFFIDFARTTDPELSDRAAAYLLSAGFVLFTVGRFSGALALRFLPAPRVLMTYAALAIACLIGAVTLPGRASVGCLMAVSFFMSIMYPTLFDLGIKSADRQPRLGAAVMVMAIVGGALMPPLLGLAADRFGIRQAYWLLTANFALIAIYGFSRNRLARSRPAA